MPPPTDADVVALLASLAQPLPGRPDHVVVAVAQVRQADPDALEAVERWVLAHGRVMRPPVVSHAFREPRQPGPVAGFVIPRAALAT
jgi:hypothetical protein